MHWLSNRDWSMMKPKMTKIISKSKKKLVKLFKKLLFGENFILGSMTKMEIIFNALYKLLPIRLVLPKRRLMIICFKLEMGKNMALTLMKKLTVKLDNLEPLSETKRKKKLEANDFFIHHNCFLQSNNLSIQIFLFLFTYFFF